MKKILKYLYGIFFLLLLTVSIFRLVDLKNYEAKIRYPQDPSRQEFGIYQRTREDGSPYLQIFGGTFCDVYYNKWNSVIIDSGSLNSFAVDEAIVEYTIYDWKNKVNVATFQADGYFTKEFEYTIEDVSYIRIERELVDYKIRFPWTRVTADVLFACVSLINVAYIILLIIQDVKRNKESLTPVQDDLYQRENDDSP